MEYNQTIYVSYRGSDFNDGFTADTPIKTINKAIEMVSLDNACLYIEGGGVYDGNLYFNNINNLFIGSYGIGVPVIKSGSRTAIHLYNCRNTSISRIKLCGEGFRIRNNSIGLLAQKCDRLLVKNIEAMGYHLAGIKMSGCFNSEVTGCFAHDNGSVGIATGSYDGVPSENIRIAHCKAYDNAGDYSNRDNHSGSGIIIGCTNHSVVEFCEAAGNGWAQRQINVNGPVGIWCCCGCDDVVFRYNISRHNRTQPGAVDGDGLDIDGEVRNGVMEYNYTYGNEGSGYLLCEFWGDCSDTLWENNITRYCVSLDDDTRVPGYGAINMSSPQDIPFDKMYIKDNFFVASKGKHCVYNKNIPSSANDMFITDNILVSDGTPAIQDPNQQYITIVGNKHIESDDVRTGVLSNAPLLTSPRDLLEQPVFGLLKNGTCYETLISKGAQALFKSYSKPVRAKGIELLNLQLYGPDLDGCDKTGDVSLYYDSIKPSVVTRLAGSGSEFFTPLPWWEKDKRYIVRTTARLQSPDVSAYLFIRDSNGNEKRKYLTGTVAEYGSFELEFTGTDKWFDSGKFVGVKLAGGHGNVYVYSVEFIELAEGDSYSVNNNMTGSLSDFRSFGDCYQAGDFIELYNGSFIEKTIQTEENSQIKLTLSCHSINSTGYAYIKCSGKFVSAPIKEGENEITLEMAAEGDTVTVGVSQNCADDGVIKIKNMQLL